MISFRASCSKKTAELFVSNPSRSGGLENQLREELPFVMPEFLDR